MFGDVELERFQILNEHESLLCDSFVQKMRNHIRNGFLCI